MNVDLLIAGRRIRLMSGEGVILEPDERFSAFTVPSDVNPYMFTDTAPGFFSDTDPGMPDAGIPLMPAEPEPDLVVVVEPGAGEIPAGAAKVFDAQLMEEVPGGVRNSGEPFWEVFSDEEAVRARVFLKDPERNAILEMPHGKMRWRIFAGILPARPDSGLRSDQVYRDSSDSKSAARLHARPIHDSHSSDMSAEYPSAGISDITVNPLPWPLDGLLLYFLCSQSGDIMIHGSGVVSGVRGWLFTGRSGSGKTTLARIFDGAGDRVIHDDRLILRREGTGWIMHSTPVYRDDEPRSAPLDHLWAISHGKSNVSTPESGAGAVAMVMANCIQQNWDGEAAARLAAAADDLAASVPVSRLSFLPDGSIRDYLLLRSTEDKKLAAGALSEMLSEGHTITITAGGYSMWPAIKPGDRVVIEPCGSTLPAAGQVVALMRDGGYVTHRVTAVIAAAGRRLLSTRGDAVMRADEPAGPETVAGVVRSVIRSGRQMPLPRCRLPRWINRLGALLVSLTRCR